MEVIQNRACYVPSEPGVVPDNRMRCPAACGMIGRERMQPRVQLQQAARFALLHLFFPPLRWTTQTDVIAHAAACALLLPSGSSELGRGSERVLGDEWPMSWACERDDEELGVAKHNHHAAQARP
jgi:hypothetical protein